MDRDGFQIDMGIPNDRQEDEQPIPGNATRNDGYRLCRADRAIEISSARHAIDARRAVIALLARARAGRIGRARRTVDTTGARSEASGVRAVISGRTQRGCRRGSGAVLSKCAFSLNRGIRAHTAGCTCNLRRCATGTEAAQCARVLSRTARARNTEIACTTTIQS